MRKLEVKTLSLIRFPLSFTIALLMTYYWRHLRLNSILDIFNSQYPSLQFTMEVESDRLNFLDVTVIRDNVC